MNLAQLLIRTINTYSIWVVVGSFCTYLFIQSLFGLPADYIAASVLAGAMWVIYTVDHVLDGLRSKDRPLARRHRIHWIKRRGLLILSLVVSSVLIYLVLFKLDRVYYPMGFILFFLTAVHFALNHFDHPSAKNRVFIKEVFIALVVSIGFVIMPLFARQTLQPFTLPVLLVVFFINWSNLLLFSYFDYTSDAKSHFLSAAHVYGREVARKLSLGILVAALGLEFWLLLKLSVVHVVILVGMTLVLLIINRFPSFFEKEGRYRFYGDIIYVLPGLILPFL